MKKRKSVSRVVYLWCSVFLLRSLLNLDGSLVSLHRLRGVSGGLGGLLLDLGGRGLLHNGLIGLRIFLLSNMKDWDRCWMDI